MALFTQASYNGYYALELEVTESGYSVPDNTSQIAWALRLRSYNASFEGWQAVRTATVDGRSVLSANAPMSMGFNSVALLGSGTLTVPHHPDGSKMLDVSAYFSTSSAQSFLPGTIQVAGQLALTTIPRASILGIADFTIGSSLPITIDKKYSTYVHDLRIYDGTILLAGWNNLSGSQTLSVTAEQINNMLYALANFTSKKLRAVLITRNGATEVGRHEITPTATVASNVVPSVSAISIVDLNGTVSALGAGFVQQMSKLRATATATPGQGAQIASYLWEFVGQKPTGNPADFAPINQSGTMPIKVTVTDTRGRTATKTQNVTINAYSKPLIAKWEPKRYLSGLVNPAGENVRIDLTASVTSLSSKNKIWYQVDYRLPKTASWTPFKAKTLASGQTINMAGSNVAPSIVIDKNFAYDFKVTVFDSFGFSEKMFRLGSLAIALDIYKRSVGLGMYLTEDTYDAYVGLKGLSVAGPLKYDEVYLSLVNGTTGGTGADAPRAFKIANLIFLAGHLTPSVSGFRLVTTLPVGYRPLSVENRTGVNLDTGSGQRFFVNTAGEVYVYGTANQRLAIGCSFVAYTIGT